MATEQQAFHLQLLLLLLDFLNCPYFFRYKLLAIVSRFCLIIECSLVFIDFCHPEVIKLENIWTISVACSCFMYGSSSFVYDIGYWNPYCINTSNNAIIFTTSCLSGVKVEIWNLTFELSLIKCSKGSKFWWLQHVLLKFLSNLIKLYIAEINPYFLF